MTPSRLARAIPSLAILSGIGLVVLGVTARQADALPQPATPAPVTVTSPADGTTVTTSTPRPHGRGAPGYAVEVVDESGSTMCGAVVDRFGQWRCWVTTAQANGVRTWTARQSPVPKAAVHSSARVRFAITAADGPAPVVITAARADGKLATPTAKTLTISGTGVPGYTVKVINRTSSIVCVTQVSRQRQWSCQVLLPVGRHSLLAVERAGRAADPVSVAMIEATVD